MAEALAHFAPFERPETLGARVREQLRSAIMAGRFRPGDKLTLRALATSLGVSMTPAREALFNLTSEGVLELRSNGSVYIPEMTAADFQELIRTRMALEGLVAAEATGKLGLAELNKISEINENLIEASQEEDYGKLVTLNWQFHFSIYSAAQMPFTLRLIEGCWLRSGSYVNLIYPGFGRTDRGIRNHIAMLRELRNGNPDGVAAAVRNDIEFSGQAFLNLLKTGELPSPPDDNAKQA